MATACASPRRSPSRSKGRSGPPSWARSSACVMPEPLTRAVEHLAAGEWQQAHKIVQDEEGALAAWLHGIVHTLEGDLDNARYWYRRAKREFPAPSPCSARS